MTIARPENEAEFQARFESRIRQALPLLPAEIKLERYLSVRLGHRALNIDGASVEPGNIKGRCDVLIKVDKVPLIIAELKAPDVELTEDDVAQVTSYARVHTPIVPLVLVTNGKEHILRRSIDGENLAPSTAGVEQLNASLEAASAIAAEGIEAAIRTLLAANESVWGSILAEWNGHELNTLVGDVADFSFPIPHGLSIPREIVSEIDGQVKNGAKVVVLHGPPLSGVTNALAQFARNDQSKKTLFLNGMAVPNVIRFLANRLSQELKFRVTKDDVRGWLNSSSGLVGLRIAIDGLPSQGIEELLDFAEVGAIQLVLGLNSAEYQVASFVSGRSEKTTLGRLAADVQLKPLSNNEFYEACEVLDRSFGLAFYNGAQHVPELRSPRRIRFLVSTADPKIVDGQRDKAGLIMPIAGPMTMRAFSRMLSVAAQVEYGLNICARVFLEEAQDNVGDPNWLASTWGQPSVDPNRLEGALGWKQLSELCEQKFLSWVSSPDLGPRILIRFEEKLTNAIAEIWAKQLAAVDQQKEIEPLVQRMLELSTVVPNGEIALAMAIRLAEQKRGNILTYVVPLLAQNHPMESVLSEGSKFFVLAKDVRISIEVGEGVEETVFGNLGAWLVLSHLLTWNLGVEGKCLNASIIAELGACPHLIVNPQPVGPELASTLHFHEFEGVGSVLCMRTGIIEPIVKAMLQHAMKIPSEFVELANFAMKKKSIHLAWRLVSVASIAQSLVNEEAATAANEVERILDPWWKQFLQQHAAAACDY